MFINNTYNLNKINNGNPYYINFNLNEKEEYKIILGVIKSMRYNIDYNNNDKSGYYIYEYPRMNSLKQFGLFINPKSKKCYLKHTINEYCLKNLVDYSFDDLVIYTPSDFKKQICNQSFKFIIFEKFLSQ
jgi:hypothetical protein